MWDLPGPHNNFFRKKICASKSCDTESYNGEVYYVCMSRKSDPPVGLFQNFKKIKKIKLSKFFKIKNQNFQKNSKFSKKFKTFKKNRKISKF